MELNKEFSGVRCVAVDGVQTSGEYTLPDYQGDVRKILYSSAEISEGGAYHSRDSLEVSGCVVYKIVYLDSEGKITPVSFTSDYEFSVRSEDDAYIDADVHTRIDSYGLRLMGPRRFSATCSIDSDVVLTEKREYKVDTAGECRLETRSMPLSVAELRLYRSGEREMAEELVSLEGAILDEVEVLLSGAEPVAVSLQNGDGTLSLRSQILVRALVKIGAELPCMYEGVLDFSEIIAADGMGEDAALIPRVSILSESVSLAAAENGVSVVASVIAEGSVRALGSGRLNVLTDCFSTAEEVSVTEGEFSYRKHLGSHIIDEKYTYTAPRSEVGAENVRNVLYESARVKIEDKEMSDKTLNVSGMIHVSAIACETSEEGAPAYVPLRFEAPFSINVNFNSLIPHNSRADVVLSLEGVHIDLDGEELRLSGNLVGAATVLCELREPCVSSVALGEKYAPGEASLVSVYYPTAGESLFDVGKKFHVSPMDIARANELSEAVVAGVGEALTSAGVGYLIIK